MRKGGYERQNVPKDEVLRHFLSNPYVSSKKITVVGGDSSDKYRGKHVLFDVSYFSKHGMLACANFHIKKVGGTT